MKHKLLPRAFFYTFDTMEEAQSYGSHLLASLDAGLIPAGLLEQLAEGKGGKSLVSLIDDYVATNTAVSQTDRDLADWVRPQVASYTTKQLDYELAQQLVRHYKLVEHKAPGTIRQRIDFLGRVVKHYAGKNGLQLLNPFRILPSGYSLYNDEEVAALEAMGIPVPVGGPRKRRLAHGEEEKIRAAGDEDARSRTGHTLRARKADAVHGDSQHGPSPARGLPPDARPGAAHAQRRIGAGPEWHQMPPRSRKAAHGACTTPSPRTAGVAGPARSE